MKPLVRHVAAYVLPSRLLSRLPSLLLSLLRGRLSLLQFWPERPSSWQGRLLRFMPATMPLPSRGARRAAQARP